MYPVTLTPLATALRTLTHWGYSFSAPLPPNAVAILANPDDPTASRAVFLAVGRVVLIFDPDSASAYTAPTPTAALGYAVQAALGYTGLVGDAEILTTVPWVEIYAPITGVINLSALGA